MSRGSGNPGARRDVYSVVLFESSPECVKEINMLQIQITSVKPTTLFLFWTDPDPCRVRIANRSQIRLVRVRSRDTTEIGSVQSYQRCMDSGCLADLATRVPGGMHTQSSCLSLPLEHLSLTTSPVHQISYWVKLCRRLPLEGHISMGHSPARRL